MGTNVSGPGAALAPGQVRRVSPTVCRVEPFAGSSADDIEQLRWVARTYARRVPFGCDWSLDRWGQEILFVDGDVACQVWLLAYMRRFMATDRAKKVPCMPPALDENLTVH